MTKHLYVYRLRLFPFAAIYIWGLCSRTSWLLCNHAEQNTLVLNDNRYDIDSAMKRAVVQGCRVACRGTITVGMLPHSSYLKKVILISSCCRATLWLSLAEETRMHHNDFLVGQIQSVKFLIDFAKKQFRLSTLLDVYNRKK